MSRHIRLNCADCCLDRVLLHPDLRKLGRGTLADDVDNLMLDVSPHLFCDAVHLAFDSRRNSMLEVDAHMMFNHPNNILFKFLHALIALCRPRL